MTYTSWKTNVTTMVNMMTKNFTMSSSEIDFLINTVYHEILNETNLTFVYEVAYPSDAAIETTSNSKQHYRIYDIDNCALGYWPECYFDAEKMEVVDVITMDGYNVRKFMDEVRPSLWIKNDHGILYGEYDDSFQEINLIFIQKCIPLIDKCEEWVYDAIQKAMMSGIQYYVQNIIPSQIDAQIDNALYLRFQNDKEAILNNYPVSQPNGRRKLPWTDIYEEMFWDKDACNPPSPCVPCEDDCLVFITADDLTLVTVFGNIFNVSCVHGSCIGGVIEPDPDYGYTCDVGVDCPDCNYFNVYNGDGTFSRLSPDSSDGLMVGWQHNGCKDGSTPNPDFDFGLQCTPDVDCPDCVHFMVYRPDGLGFYDFHSYYQEDFFVGSKHGSCSGVIIPPDPEPETSPVTEFTGNPKKGTVDFDVQFTDASANTPTSWNWTFGDGSVSTIQNPLKTYTVPGIYSVSLEAINAFGTNTKTRVDYITVMATYGLQCNEGVDCPDCNTFNVINEDRNGFDPLFLQDGYLMVGEVYGGCGDANP